MQLAAQPRSQNLRSTPSWKNERAGWLRLILGRLFAPGQGEVCAYCKVNSPIARQIPATAVPRENSRRRGQGDEPKVQLAIVIQDAGSFYRESLDPGIRQCGHILLPLQYAFEGNLFPTLFPGRFPQAVHL